MLKGMRSKLTYANVMSTLAAFAVLTGVGYAVAKVTTNQIKNGAVTSKKIRKNAVNANKIRSGAVGRSELANGAVGTGQISNSAVTTSKLANGAVTTAKVDSNSLPFLATLRTGQTLRGMFDVGSTQVGAAANTAVGGTSFQFPLVNTPTAPQANVLDVQANPGASTTSCPGLAGGNQQTPNAAAGQLCVYIAGKTNLDTSTPVSIVNTSRLGFGLKATSSPPAAGSPYEATGFWAVTAP